MLSRARRASDRASAASPASGMLECKLEQLVAALRDDDSHSLTHDVELALEFARDHLLDAATGAGSGAVDGAVEQVIHAIESLVDYRERLEQLAADFERMERDFARLRSGDVNVGDDGSVGLLDV